MRKRYLVDIGIAWPYSTAEDPYPFRYQVHRRRPGNLYGLRWRTERADASGGGFGSAEEAARAALTSIEKFHSAPSELPGQVTITTKIRNPPSGSRDHLGFGDD
jgi:hypothetical protein